MGGRARLGLGTVQFGLDYGVTNERGRIGECEAAEILGLAALAGIDVLDTAHLYGKSEEVIGAALPAEAQPKIVTKSPKFASALSADNAVLQLRSAFTLSVRRLRRRPYGLLFHDAADLLGDHGDALWSTMSQLKDEGQVERIGISVYEGTEIERVLDRYPIDLVQIPWNPLDRRLHEGGQLDRLRAAGVQVHARSLFLQGLLLQPVEKIAGRFGALRAAVGELAASSEAAGATRLESILALAFLESRIDRFVCGVTSTEQLEAIVLAAERADPVKERISFTLSHRLDPRVLNPSRWGELR